MLIIGCDFHPRFQQIAYLDKESGEYGERRLNHPEQAAQFYRSLAGRQLQVGLEATGSYGWFRRLLGEMGHTMLLGNPVAIHASNLRKQKTDKRDARAGGPSLGALFKARGGCPWSLAFGDQGKHKSTLSHDYLLTSRSLALPLRRGTNPSLRHAIDSVSMFSSLWICPRA